MRLGFAILVFASLTSAAQSEDFYIGFVADARAVLLRGGTDPFVKPLPSWGAGIGLTGLYNVSPAISLLGSLQPIGVETVRFETNDGGREIETNGVGGTEFSGTVLFRPVRDDKYSIVAGTGISTKRNWNDDFSGYTKSWNFRVPLQAGVELPAGTRCKIMMLAEYQFGLRKVYLNAFRTDTFGLKFIAMWPKPKD